MLESQHAMVAYTQGKLDAAREGFASAIARHERIGSRGPHYGAALAAFGSILSDTGSPREGARCIMG